MKSEKTVQDFFTVAEVAARFRVSPRTVWKWISDTKELPVHRFGRGVRISHHDLGMFERNRREV